MNNVYKLIYLVGVYTICVLIHESFNEISRRIHEEQKEKKLKKTDSSSKIGIRPVNKIGFEIPVA